MSATLIAGVVGLLICMLLPDTKSVRKYVCIGVFLCLFCQSGLRDYKQYSERSEGNDTGRYFMKYQRLMDQSLDEVVFENQFRVHMDDYDSRDPAYDIFVKLSQLVWPDFRFLLILIAIIITAPLVWMIYKFSNSLPAIVLAVMLYEALFANFFETGFRQTIAMGIIYASLPFVIKRLWLPHYLMLLLAYFFHSSALIFIPFYLLTCLNINRNYLLWALLLTPVVIYFSKDLILWIAEDTMFESYAKTTKDNTGTPVFSALLLVVSIGVWIFSKYFNMKNIKIKMLMVALICALLLMPSTWINSNFIRLVFYYLVFLMPLVPRVLNVITTNQNYRDVIYFATGGALIVLTL